jgi:hypothetical protein
MVRASAFRGRQPSVSRERVPRFREAPAIVSPALISDRMASLASGGAAAQRGIGKPRAPERSKCVMHGRRWSRRWYPRCADTASTSGGSSLATVRHCGDSSVEGWAAAGDAWTFARVSSVRRMHHAGSGLDAALQGLRSRRKVTHVDYSFAPDD